MASFSGVEPMTVLAPPLSPRLAPGASIRPTAKLWTVDEFHRLSELGVFEGRQAQLIDGTILEEGPMNPPHATAVELAGEVLRVVFGKGWRVRSQLPIVLGQQTDPQPDFAFLRGSARDTVEHPTTAELAVEISDASLKFDSTDKADRYSLAGIPEYWVLDLNGRQLLVFRDPVANGYGTKFTVAVDGSVAPLAVPGVTVAVAALLP